MTYKKIISNKLYLKLLISDVISNLGDVLYFIALMTYVIEIKDSNLAISIINFSETIPVLFTIFFGMIADKTLNKVSMIIRTLWLRVILYLLMAIVMTFKASILVVIIASIVNLIADTLGRFENGLLLFIKRTSNPCNLVRILTQKRCLGLTSVNKKALKLCLMLHMNLWPF